MFDANKITLNNFEGIFPCRKKPLLIHALQINLPEGFFVDSLEGKHSGKPGDYLMFGVKGEKYICDKEIFEATYDCAAESESDQLSANPGQGGRDPSVHGSVIAG